MMNKTRNEICIFHYVCNMVGCKTCKNFKISQHRLKVLKKQKRKREQLSKATIKQLPSNYQRWIQEKMEIE